MCGIIAVIARGLWHAPSVWSGIHTDWICLALDAVLLLSHCHGILRPPCFHPSASLLVWHLLSIHELCFWALFCVFITWIKTPQSWTSSQFQPLHCFCILPHCNLFFWFLSRVFWKLCPCAQLTWVSYATYVFFYTGLSLFHQASFRAGLEPISNQFFAFQQSKNWLLAMKTGSSVAQTFC